MAQRGTRDHADDQDGEASHANNVHMCGGPLQDAGTQTGDMHSGGDQADAHGGIADVQNP